MQPINITPVQPQLAENDLFLLGGLGPAQPSFNEFNPLFLQNRFSLLASGLLGTHETYGNEVVQSGIWNQFSYSLGQLHYETDGFKSNNDLNLDLYNLFAQGNVSQGLMLQGEFRHRDVEHGDITSVFARRGQVRRFRTEAQSDIYRAGMHIKPTDNSSLIASIIYQDTNVEEGVGSDESVTTGDGYIGELQYLYRQTYFNVIYGGGYYSVDTTLDPGNVGKEVTHGNTYLYSHIYWPADLTWIFGIGIDWIDDEDLGPEPFNPVNPKLGVLWNLTPFTTLRLAGFRVAKRSLLANQTLEPTQVAGFNQLYDDFNGTQSWRYGVGIDHQFTSELSVGLEVSRRELNVPTLTLEEESSRTSTEFLEREERFYRAYLNWTPRPDWAAVVEYFREDFNDREDGGLPDTTTQIVPASITYFSPLGMFARVSARYLHQRVQLQSEGDEESNSDDNEFIDLALGYRFPKRYGIAEVQFLNLLDKDYRFEGLQDRSPPPRAGIPSFLPFPPELTVFFRMTVAF